MIKRNKSKKTQVDTELKLTPCNDGTLVEDGGVVGQTGLSEAEQTLHAVPHERRADQVVHGCRRDKRVNRMQSP